MLLTALKDPDPVLIFEHAMLFAMQGPLTNTEGGVDIDHAMLRRAGTDVSLMDDATLVQWYVAVGQSVKRGPDWSHRERKGRD